MKKLNKVISFFKSNYTKEEVLQLDKKELKQIAKQKGFAIGTILIAIALIAAVGAAIAIASKSTTDSGNGPQSKLLASNVITQGSAIKQTIDVIRLNFGADLTNIVFNPYANGLETGSDSNLTSDGLNKYGIFNPTIGTSFVQLDNKTFSTPPLIIKDSDQKNIKLEDGSATGKGSAAGFTGGGYNNWYLGTIASNAGTSAIDDAIFLTGIKEEVCLEINKSANGTNGMTGLANIPTVASAASLAMPWAGANITNRDDVILTGGNSANVDAWTEGCLRDNTTSQYIYFNVLKTK